MTDLCVSDTSLPVHDRPVCVCFTNIKWSHFLWISTQVDLLPTLCCKTTADQPNVLTPDAVCFELAWGVNYLSGFIVGVSMDVAVAYLGHRVCTSQLRCPVHMCTPSEFKHFITKPVVAYGLCTKLFYSDMLVDNYNESLAKTKLYDQN